jgi:ABC-type multidrug transport system fused ATPase/permease subunit
VMDMTISDIPRKPFKYMRFITQNSRLLVICTIAANLTGGILQNLMPYTVKRLVDIAAQGEAFRKVWVWGGIFIGLYFASELLFRVSGFSGLVAAVRAKAASYNTLLHFLADSSYYDEPGEVVTRVTLASEGNGQILQGALGADMRVILKIIAGMLLALTVHPILFGICAGWLLAHIVSAWFIMRFKKRFTKLVAETTSKLQGALVNFCRIRMFTPEQVMEKLPETVYTLRQTVAERKESQQLDWRIAEGICGLYSLVHGLFIGLIVVGILFLCQAQKITAGDIAMILAVIQSTKSSLFQYTNIAIRIGTAWAEIDAGLEYLHTQHPTAIKAPSVQAHTQPAA